MATADFLRKAFNRSGLELALADPPQERSSSMNLTLRIDTALAKTFSVLREIRYQASSQVLAHGLKSSIPIIRSASLQSLLERGTAYDYSAILQCIDRSTPTEIDKIRQHASRMTEVIDQGLASSDPETRQRALWTIAKMGVETHFHFLIDVACNPDDPQQMVAIELTSFLAKTLGNRSQENDESQEDARLTLLAELSRGLESYPQHRVQAMFDWWAATAREDDEILLSAIRDSSTDESSQRLVHYLERSKTKDCQELVARFLWSRTGCTELIAIAARRSDHGFVESLGLLCRSLKVSKDLTRNLNLPNITLACLREEVFRDERITLAAKVSLVQLSTIQGEKIEVVLPRINWLIENADPSLDGDIALLLDQQKPINTDIAVIALSDALDSPDIESSVPPPWKQEMRLALEGLIHASGVSGPRLQKAIAHFLREFRCEKLLEKLLDWPVAHLTAYARLSRIADSKFLEILMIELGVQSPVRRQRGIRAAHLYGMDRCIEAMIINKLEDPVDEVRIEAIHALADAVDRENAIAILSPLEVDSNPEVNQAAGKSLMKLRGEL
jgi:hypothetical protein